MTERFNLGEYEVLQALTTGGMGEVVLARRRGPAGFEQLCAIKTIRGDLAASPVARTMFLDEARLLARLTHPAIAQIIDVGEQGDTLYMVIEYVPGVHFRRLGERNPTPAVACAAMAAACRGLHAAHELRDVSDGRLLGVVHRDISPDNLMLGFDGRVKVLDFGIALVRGRQAPVTEFGVLKGKPPYMSPEQVKNQTLDRRSDVFSACVVLYELLTGQHLFVGDSIYAVARAVEHDPIVPPSTRRGPLPPELDHLVLAGLERDRDQRLATAAAMAEVLDRIVAQSASESLEAWVEREFAAERDAHREWLAKVVASSRRMPAVGRPTGLVTAVDASIERLTTLDRPIADSSPPVPAPSEGPPPRIDTGTLVPAGRVRRRISIIFLLTLAGVLAWILSRGGGPVVGGDIATAPRDASVPAVAIDARAIPALADAVPADASSAVDAGRRPHRPINPADAAPVAAPAIDAAPRITDAATPVGDGYVTIHATPYADIDIDGSPWGATPILRRRIRAGHHVVILRSPDDGRVVLRREIQVAPGKTVEVFPP